MAEKALSEGVSPLDVMLTTMRSLWTQAVDGKGQVVNIGKAMQANIVAKDAAPYLHPKLANVDHSSADGTMTPAAPLDLSGLTEDQLKALAAIGAG